MRSYAYNAALYCERCAQEIIEDLAARGIEDDGTTDAYPQPVHNDESDCPEHCDNCREFLENALTTHGKEYVREQLATHGKDSIAWIVWQPFYDLSGLHVVDYELCDLGIEHPDYFQGFGCSFTPYDNATYGIGEDPREALADALDQIGQAGFDADSLAKRIAADEGWAIERGEVMAPTKPRARGESHYHVGIRWTAAPNAQASPPPCPPPPTDIPVWRKLEASEFASAYVACALWSSMDNSDDQGGAPLDDNYGIDDLSDECAAAMLADCEDFQESQREILAQSGLSAAQQGYDFWLTRNGHGAGFWDRGIGKLGEQLTSAAQEYGACDLYVGDDGKIYC